MKIVAPIEPDSELIQSDRPLLSDAVVAKVTQHIISRALMPGDMLPSESDIGRRYGVSKPVVREALRKLAALGIVDIRQGKASSVGNLAPEPVRQMLRFAMHINRDGLREAIELRRALETHTVVLAAHVIDAEGVERLAAVVDRMEALVDQRELFVAADLEFHQLVAHFSGNSLIAFLIAALSDSMRETISTLYDNSDVSRSGSVTRHRAIVGALRENDPEAAAAAMDAHFGATSPIVDALTKERMSINS